MYLIEALFLMKLIFSIHQLRMWQQVLKIIQKNGAFYRINFYYISVA